MAALATRLLRTERRIAQRQAEPVLVYQDPVFFARHRLGFSPDPWQEHVLSWTGNKLLLNCSRQAGKSTVAAILALHQSLYHPSSLTLLISPSLRQSSELFRKVTDLLALLPVRPLLTEDNRLSLRLKNRSRVVSLPSSEATVRGFSAVSLLIFDEAARVQDSLFHACQPMLAVSGGRLVALSTPFGRRGFFHQEWTDGEGWERVCVTASECPRISKEFLDGERRSMPNLWFRSEYLCQFVDTLDQVFLTEFVMAALDNDIPPLFPQETFH